MSLSLQVRPFFQSEGNRVLKLRLSETPNPRKLCSFLYDFITVRDMKDPAKARAYRV